MQAQKKVMVTTPIGSISWFSLHKVDNFGNYTANLHLEDAPETHKLISIIDSMGAGNKPYKKQADGSVVLKLKSKSKGQKKDGSMYVVNPPVIYNALGAKLSAQEVAELNVGNGSKLRAKLELSTYTMQGGGVSAKLKSAQLVEVIKFMGGDADLGFDAFEFSEVDDIEESSSFDGVDSDF